MVSKRFINQFSTIFPKLALFYLQPDTQSRWLVKSEKSYSNLSKRSLTHLRPMFPFFNPRKHQKTTQTFLMFSEGIERDQWHKMQSSRGIFIKTFSENIQRICRRTRMPKCDLNWNSYFNKHFYWNHTSAWAFSCKFAAYFHNTFS